MTTSPARRVSFASRVWAREVVRPARHESGPKNLFRFVVFACLAAYWLMAAGSARGPIAFPYMAGVFAALVAMQALLIFAVQIKDDVHIHRDQRRAAASED